MRLIDADHLKRRFPDSANDSDYDQSWNSTVRSMIREEPTMMCWVPVTDHLPEEDVEVLVCTRSKNGTQNIDKGYWYHRAGIIRWVHRGAAEVTHWMPMPELPDEEGERK